LDYVQGVFGLAYPIQMHLVYLNASFSRTRFTLSHAGTYSTSYLVQS
jgi:hypothetical protein